VVVAPKDTPDTSLRTRRASDDGVTDRRLSRSDSAAGLTRDLLGARRSDPQFASAALSPPWWRLHPMKPER